MAVDYSKIQELLGDDAETLLGYSSPKISKDNLYLPGGDFVDRVWIDSDRNPMVLRSLQTLFDNGRLSGTGYLSILPVDQGIEHSAGASFAPNPKLFDPKNIVELAIEGGCNAVASTYGVLGEVPGKYAHKIPFIVKINHNELLTYPNKFDQILFGTIEQARNIWARLRSARRSILVRTNPTDKSPKSPRPLPMRTNWEWRRFSGVICEIPNSKLQKAICTPPLI